jgi:hypothetical protein
VCQPPAHLVAERLQPAERADHHFEVDDSSGCVEADQVDALQFTVADAGAELQRHVEAIAAGELPLVGKAREHAEDRTQDQRDRRRAAVGPEGHRRAEDGIRMQQRRQRRVVAGGDDAVPFVQRRGHCRANRWIHRRSSTSAPRRPAYVAASRPACSPAGHECPRRRNVPGRPSSGIPRNLTTAGRG